MALLLLLLPGSRGRRTPAGERDRKASYWRYTRLPAPASRARQAMLRWLSLKAAALHASSPACAHDVSVKVAVQKKKRTTVDAGRPEVLACDAKGRVR